MDGFVQVTVGLCDVNPASLDCSPHRLSRRLTAWLLRLPLKGGVIEEMRHQTYVPATWGIPG